MPIDFSIKIKNYKCFLDEAHGFDKIYPINIIIGKNNSGKSSLIDLIEYVTDPQKDIIKTAESKSQCVISLIISDNIIQEVANNYDENSPKTWVTFIKDASYSYINKEVEFSVLPSNTIAFFAKTNFEYGQYAGSFINTYTSLYNKKKFRRINAERDIRAEWPHERKLVIEPNGEGATWAIKQIVNHNSYDTNIIKKLLLTELNKILNPDINILDIHPQEITDSKPNTAAQYEIYLSTSTQEEYIALSKMGSGIKTIFLVLLNLIVIPKIDGISKENLFLGFEELENNLHPSLQRKLFNYINKYAIENKATFFITTHSSIVIDIFSTNNNAQIIHVEQNGKKSIAKRIETQIDGKNILQDLGYKASDLLLSNGIIWVEGPSDAIYLELFIELYKNLSNENLSRLNYTIQTLSTAIWKYAGFSDFDWDRVKDDTRNQIISLTKINHNHLLIIDNDGNYDDKKPSDWNLFDNGTGKNKAKLLYESLRNGGHSEGQLINNFGDADNGTMFFWINDGTFETYLKYFIESKGKNEFGGFFEMNESRNYLEKKRQGANSSKSKVELSIEIANFSVENNLNLEDFAPVDSPLYNKIKRLFETIKSWN